MFWPPRPNFAACDRAGPHPPLRIGGLVLAGVGVTALSASQLAMGDAWRVGIDPAERTALITTGPFGYVRNPIYSANLAVGLGLTLAVPNPFSVAGLAVLVADTELYVRRVEEPHLARVHSAQWRRYASDVGRFVPQSVASPTMPIGLDMSSASERYMPAAGRAWLTGSYDRVVALSMRERAWRPALVDAIQRDLPPAGTVVDVGCGTGSLTVALATARPDARVFGVDGDPAILALARRKRGAERVTWLHGLAQSFLLPVASADVALCSLLLQHIADVLTADGVLHVADWGPPRGPATALGAHALQLIDGHAGPQSLRDGRLPTMLTAAGFTTRRQAALRTIWGTLELWRAQRDRA